MEMNFAGVVAAVLTANMLTIAFVWGMSRASRYADENKIPGLVYAALLVPPGFGLLCFIGAGWSPPFLAALASQ